MAGGHGGGGGSPALPPKQDELQRHLVKDQLLNIAYCITSPPWPEAILLGFQHYLVMLASRLESSGQSYCWNELVTMSTKYRDLTTRLQLALTGHGACPFFQWQDSQVQKTKRNGDEAESKCFSSPPPTLKNLETVTRLRMTISVYLLISFSGAQM